MFEWIKTFLTVYETKNFSLAAEKLFISQPTVSMHIKKLEQTYALTLFERNGKQSVLPTAEADFLYPKLATTMQQMQRAFAQVTQKEQFKEACTIACSHTVAMYLLPDIMQQLLARFPQVKFTVQMMNSNEVVQALQKNQVQLGLIEKPLATGNLRKSVVYEDQLVLAGAKEAPFWLLREAHSGLRFFNELYLDEHVTNLPTMEINNAEVLMQFIKKNIGKSIVSKLALSNDLPWEPLPPYFEARKISLLQNIQIEQPVITRIYETILEQIVPTLH
jgi:Transcriptional regulator